MSYVGPLRPHAWGGFVRTVRVEGRPDVDAVVRVVAQGKAVKAQKVDVGDAAVKEEELGALRHRLSEEQGTGTGHTRVSRPAALIQKPRANRAESRGQDGAGTSRVVTTTAVSSSVNACSTRASGE